MMKESCKGNHSCNHTEDLMTSGSRYIVTGMMAALFMAILYSLQFLRDEFLGYLTAWERSVSKRPGDFSAKERSKMKLSHETLAGIRMTGMELSIITDLYYYYS